MSGPARSFGAGASIGLPRARDRRGVPNRHGQAVPGARSMAPLRCRSAA
jgi:hypothetical protein